VAEKPSILLKKMSASDCPCLICQYYTTLPARCAILRNNILCHCLLDVPCVCRGQLVSAPADGSRSCLSSAKSNASAVIGAAATESFDLAVVSNWAAW
jgi:hypothetical protein